MIGVDTEISEIVQATAHLLFFLSPHVVRTPHQFPEHHALQQSRVLHTRHKTCEQDPPRTHNHLDALTSRLHKRVQIGNRVVGAIVITPTDALVARVV